MARVFVDSGAWIALADPQNQFRAVARNYYRAIARESTLVTSNYVVQEVVTNLVYSGLRRYVQAFREMLAASQHIRWLEVVWITPDLHEASWQVFERFDDRRLSFADCSSIAICQMLQIETAFSFDRHLRLAGIATAPSVST